MKTLEKIGGGRIKINANITERIICEDKDTRDPRGVCMTSTGKDEMFIAADGTCWSYWMSGSNSMLVELTADEYTRQKERAAANTSRVYRQNVCKKYSCHVLRYFTENSNIAVAAIAKTKM